MMLCFFVMAPVDVDIAFELYLGSMAIALVNNGGEGDHEWIDVEAQGGMWKVRIFCPDYTSNTWGEDYYVLDIWTYMATQDVVFEPSCPKLSMRVCKNPSRAPQIRVFAANRAQHEQAQLSVFDITGRRVASTRIPPLAEWSWRLPELSSGTYFARLNGDASTFSATRRLVVVR